MSHTLLQEFIATTYTRSDIHYKTMLLKEFFSKTFFAEEKKGSIKVSLGNFLEKENVPKDISDELISLSDTFLNSVTRETFERVCSELEKGIQNIPSLVVYTPVLLSKDEVKKLSIWFRKNVAPTMLMDIKVDINVIGGCAFVWNGVYHDYSLRYFLDQHRTEIKTLMRGYNGGEK